MKRRDILELLTVGGAGVAALGLGGLALATSGSDEQLGHPTGTTAKRVRGILGQRAPALQVPTWFNLPAGKRSVDLADYKDKVLYLYFFQSWCPGCHKSGFPTLQKVSTHFKDADDVAFLAVQTVFEGFGTNTAKRAKEVAQRYALKMPVGHDPGPKGSGSQVMRRYRSGGTPWTVIVDKGAIVRFNAFHIRPPSAISFIEKLRLA